ncbi:MAG: PAS domain S-box protein [Sterolibacterium sp.]
MNTLPFTILIVDDTPNNLFALDALLKQEANCHIVQAQSGPAALAATVENSIDLILLDIQMPGMDGYETAQHLKMTARTRDIPIIFLTAVFKSEEFVKRGYQVGAVDYLTKPLDDNQLLNRISLYRTLSEREIALRKALKKLQFKSEERFRAYFERSMVGMAIVSPEKACMEVNEALCRTLGYSRDELLRMHLSALSHPDDAAPDEAQLARLLNGEIDGYSMEKRFIHKNGHSVYASQIIGGVHAEQGGIDYLVVMVEDITERKRAEAEILASQRNLAAAQQIAHLGSWALDLGHRRLTCSAEMFRIFGIPAEEFGTTYETFLNTLHPDDHDRVDQAYTSSLLPEGRFDIEYRIFRKVDGQLRWVYACCEHERTAQGKVLRSVGTVQDITERKQAEEALRRANADLTRFAEVSAHHLMEPTRRLVSYAQRLRVDLSRLPAQGGYGEVSTSLDTLEHDANRLRGMVRDIQLYLAAGEPRDKEKMEDTNAVLLAVERRFSDRIKALGTRLDIQPLPAAYIDRPRLTDLFAELLENALLHGRPIEPKAEQRIRIYGERDGTLSRYHVCDNGPGIPGEYTERVFQIFERLGPGNGPDDANAGTGIGLSIARRIVESRYGRIWIENLPQGGAMVVFELPDGEVQ